MSFWSSCLDHAPLFVSCLSQQGFLIITTLIFTYSRKWKRMIQKKIERERERERGRENPRTQWLEMREMEVYILGLLFVYENYKVDLDRWFAHA